MKKNNTKHTTNEKDKQGAPLIQIFESFLESRAKHGHRLTEHEIGLLNLIKVFRILNNLVCFIENNSMHNVKDKSAFIEQIREHGHLFQLSLEKIKKCIELDIKTPMTDMEIEKFLEYTPKIIELLDAAKDAKWDLISDAPKELLEHMKNQIRETGNMLVQFIQASVGPQFSYALFGT